MDTTHNNPGDASTGKDLVGFPVATCEIPLTRIGNCLLNNLWGLVHSDIHINVA